MLSTFTLRTGILITLLASFALSANAQNWGDFDQLLSQLDSAKRAEFELNRVKLDNGFNPGSYDLNAVLKNLQNAANGSNPVPNNLNNLLPDSSAVRDSLALNLDGFNLDMLDSLALLNQFDTLSSVWSQKNDSLSQLFDLYKNNLGGYNQLPTNPGAQSGLLNSGLDSLIRNQNLAFNNTNEVGFGSFDRLLNELFSPALFTLFEINAGTQSVRVNYYDIFEKLQLPTIGIRSLEQFDRTWEPRWRVQASWSKNPTGIVKEESISQQSKDFNPFMFNGSFDMMYSPVVGSTAVRAIALLGIEVGVYAPAHRSTANPQSLKNEGNTTGWGPVVGAGMATRVGQNLIYALGTTSLGDVVVNPDALISNYKYRSSRLEAGVRFGNYMTLRYEMGLAFRWAHLDDKTVRFQQITVGLPTTALFR